MPRRSVWYCVFLCGFWSCPPAIAADSQTFGIGIDLLSFDYSEFDQAGELLDRETGLLPGVVASWRYQWPEWYIAANIDYHGGNVTYDGQTQSGIPLVTTTETHITDLRFMGGYTFHLVEGAASSVYAGLGYHYWYRNILPGRDIYGSPVAGLLEIYQWTFVLAGVELGLHENRSTRVALDLRAKHLLQGTMDIDFLGFGNFDNTTVDLGLGGSFRIGIPFSIRLEEKSRLVIEPYFDSWNIPRSNVVPLTIQGSTTGIGVLEPRSETRNFGLSVQYRTRF